MTSSTNYQCIMKYMPDEIRNTMRKVDMSDVDKLTEIRMYNGRGMAYISTDKIGFLDNDGKINVSFSEKSVKISSAHLKNIVSNLCRCSLYSHAKELSEGCFVLENGIRAGISGGYCNGQVQTLQEFASLNFRMPRQIKGCGKNVADRLYGKNILICGSVNSGKTTMLRDICRLYGNVQKCTLIDERNEIAALKNGIPTNDIGLLTDVISGRTRHDGIISAVRTLSPQYIFCDEIADKSDAEAVLCGFGSGVSFVASIHASSYSELMKRQVVLELAEKQVFDSAVFLYGAENPSAVKEIRSLKNDS